LALFLAGVTFSQIPSQNTIDLFAACRIVAAGERTYKTSISTTESGEINAMYSERGVNVITSLYNLLNYLPSD
jgi:hypothetical protein